MKKILFILSFTMLFSCSDDCKIDSEKISNLSAEINVLEAKIASTNNQTEIAIYERQISDLKAQITIEADRCD